MTRFSRRSFLMSASAVLAGCSTSAPDQLRFATKSETQSLETAILNLGNVDAKEAANAADIALNYPRQLAVAYQITDPPLIHNTKVNAGTRPRGLCWHWADDLEKRLAQRRFETLDLHRAIANADNPFRIDHSTVIISAKGAGMMDGIVLDPWRNGGLLYWGKVPQDKKYKWRPRKDVQAERRRRSVLPQS